jgi:hypothetical protein
MKHLITAYACAILSRAVTSWLSEALVIAAIIMAVAYANHSSRLAK